MTQEEFKDLQLDMQQSGMSVTKYLQHVGINYNTYNYWRKKQKENDSPKPELAPISFTQHADPVFSLLELLNKSLSTRVLPEWYDALLPMP